jgi:hypothetical protein
MTTDYVDQTLSENRYIKFIDVVTLHLNALLKTIGDLETE